MKQKKEALDFELLFCYNEEKLKLINSYREVTIMTMTEDIVNEICKVCSGVLGDFGMFSIFKREIRCIDDELSGFYPFGERIDLSDLDFSIEAERFLSDISWFNDDTALVFFIENDTIRMHFCFDSWDGFQPELSFTFKKTFCNDLFD